MFQVIISKSFNDDNNLFTPSCIVSSIPNTNNLNSNMVSIILI